MSWVWTDDVTRRLVLEFDLKHVAVMMRCEIGAQD